MGTWIYLCDIEVSSRLLGLPHRRPFVSKRILIVDDNVLIRELIRLFIERRPEFEVCGEASDGVEGIERGRELKPDLIVLDFLMPRANGLQTAARLQEVVPNTPIILLTLHKEAIPIPVARAAGVASVLSKTDQLPVLADEIKRLTGWIS
jgi:two-component system nitrate/nitrite response regulator NarL